MAVVCVVYDLQEPGQRWAAMDDAIEAMKLEGGRPFNTTWFFKTTLSPGQVFDKIGHVADTNDKLIVFKATEPGVWKGLNAEWTKWLQANL